MHIPRGKRLNMNNHSNNRRYVAHGNVDNSAEFPTFPQAQQQILCCPLTSVYFSQRRSDPPGGHLGEPG